MSKEKKPKKEDFGENFPLCGIPPNMRKDIMKIKKPYQSINSVILSLIDEGLNYYNANN